MSKRVRAIVIQDKKILSIKRCKNNEAYFVLPGGGVFAGESDELALQRECLEELNVSVKVGALFFEELFNLL